MIACVCLETTDLERVRRIVLERLEPDSSAFVRTQAGWVAAYPDNVLEEADLEPLADALAPCVVCFQDEAELRVARLESRDARRPSSLEETNLPPALLADFETLFASPLPEGTFRLEREAEKPGLGAYFGRSVDE